MFSSYVSCVCVKCRLVNIRVHIRSDFLSNDINLRFSIFVAIPLFPHHYFFLLTSLMVHLP
jgi:hypothetical protein